VSCCPDFFYTTDDATLLPFASCGKFNPVRSSWGDWTASGQLISSSASLVPAAAYLQPAPRTRLVAGEVADYIAFGETTQKQKHTDVCPVLRVASVNERHAVANEEQSSKKKEWYEAGASTVSNCEHV
jgi:hypothetical protein